MNDDEKYLRVAARTRALPMLADVLGEHVAANLVRTADLLRDDAEYLDKEAEEAYAGLRRNPPSATPDYSRLTPIPWPRLTEPCARAC